jgi:arylsulfatase A-like enzyme
MSRALSRLRELFPTSAIAAVIAALAGGVAEVSTGAESGLHAAGGIGFTALIAVPLGAFLSLLARLLWRAWRPRELAASLTDPESGGVPRLVAWLLTLAAGAVAASVLVLQGMNAVTSESTARVVYSLAAPILAIAGAALVGALSRPAVDGLAAGLARIDRAWARRRGGPLFTPARALVGILVLAAALLAGAWLVTIEPHVGYIDLSFLPALIVWLLALVAAPIGLGFLRARPRAGAALAAAAGTVLCACAATALWLRYQRPYAMLEIWGESKIAGTAIDWLYDIESLRGELEIEGIEPARQPGVTAHPDVVLITIDTMRADRTPLYDGPARMPALASLGPQAAVFQWAFSPGNVTRRSLPSMAIGVSAPRLRGRVAGWALRLDPRHILLAERFRAAGYDTAGFFCCTSQFADRHRLGLIRGIDQEWIEKDGERLAGMAVRWLRQRRSARPLFLWVHLIEPHGWEKDHPAAVATRKREQRYDMGLADADRALGQLLDAVWKDPARRARTVLVVTSDHGEGLGDHGVRNHAATLYNSEIRVPLVIAGPGIQARRIERPVGLHDLAPTLLDLAGFVPPGMPAMDGASLAPVLRGTAPDTGGEAYAAMIEDRSVSSSSRALVAGSYKIIQKEGKPYELYDVRADPHERKNLYLRQPELAAEMKRKLAARKRTDGEDPF